MNGIEAAHHPAQQGTKHKTISQMVDLSDFLKPESCFLKPKTSILKKEKNEVPININERAEVSKLYL